MTARRPQDMRALTLWQPWASLIIAGPKRIENRRRRPWARLIGQPIGIHAAGRRDDDVEARYASQYALAQPLPHSALLGFARIVGVVTDSDDAWFVGPVGIQLADVVAYPVPVPMPGAQGYWSVTDRLAGDRDERGQAEHWHERAAKRSRHGDMPADIAAWWALYDVLRPEAQP